MIESIDQLTFSGLDRPAMVLGAPLKPLGVIFLSLAIITMPFLLIYGIRAFLILSLIIPVYLILRFLCEKDENALNVLRYSLKYFKHYRKANTIFSVPTFLPLEYGVDDVLSK